MDYKRRYPEHNNEQAMHTAYGIICDIRGTEIITLNISCSLKEFGYNNLLEALATMADNGWKPAAEILNHERAIVFFEPETKQSIRINPGNFVIMCLPEK